MTNMNTIYKIERNNFHLAENSLTELIDLIGFKLWYFIIVINYNIVYLSQSEAYIRVSRMLNIAVSLYV